MTGQTSGELGKLDQQPVRIPGFMVPLEDDQKSVTEFLLVPTPQACIHMPPPPPNQMVLVRFPEGIPVAFGAIWVYGKLEIKSKRHEYGESSFQMEGATVEKYQN